MTGRGCARSPSPAACSCGPTPMSAGARTNCPPTRRRISPKHSPACWTVPDRRRRFPMTAASFTYTANPARIVFGQGTLEGVRAEVERLGRSRVLVLAGPSVAAVGDRVDKALGPLAVGRFDGSAMHTPVAVTEQALELLRKIAA